MTKQQQQDDSLYKNLLDDEEYVHGVVVNSNSDPSQDISPYKKKGPQRKTSRFSVGGCLCKCVLISLALLTLLTLAMAAGAYFWMKDVVQHLTVAESKTFPVVRMSEAERDLLQNRVMVFFDELRLSKEPAEDLIITQDELNGFLCGSDYLRGHMQVTLTKDKIFEEYSLPMDMVPGGKGRFFGGHDYTSIDETKQRIELQMETTATHQDWFVGPLFFFQLHFETGDYNDYHQRLLALFVENGSIFGNVIPDDAIAQHANLLQDAYDDPDSGKDIRAIVEGIEHVSIEDGKIVVHPRRRYQKTKDDFPARPVPIETTPSNSSSGSSTNTITMFRSSKVSPAAPKNTFGEATSSTTNLRSSNTVTP